MRGLVSDGPGRIRSADDLPEPTLHEPGDVVVRVTRAGLCGSDLHPYLDREPARPGVVPGHEAVGVVAAVGSAVRTVGIGERVIIPFTTSCGSCPPCVDGLSARCVRSQLLGWADPIDRSSPALHGCQAEMVRVPDADGSLLPTPADLDDDVAMLLPDNLPTGFHAARMAGVRPGIGDVLVVGLGAVGRCAALSALALGADRVLVTDADQARLDDAAGALPVHAVATTEVDRLGLGAVIEAAGPSAAQALAASATRPGATVSIIAVQTAEVFGISPVLAYDRNLTICCGRAPVRSLLPEVLDLLAAGSLDPEMLATIVTHPGRPLAEGPQLYADFAAHEDGIVKATFDLALDG